MRGSPSRRDDERHERRPDDPGYAMTPHRETTSMMARQAKVPLITNVAMTEKTTASARFSGLSPTGVRRERDTRCEDHHPGGLRGVVTGAPHRGDVMPVSSGNSRWMRSCSRLQPSDLRQATPYSPALIRRASMRHPAALRTRAGPSGSLESRTASQSHTPRPQHTHRPGHHCGCSYANGRPDRCSPPTPLCSC